MKREIMLSIAALAVVPVSAWSRAAALSTFAPGRGGFRTAGVHLPAKKGGTAEPAKPAKPARLPGDLGSLRQTGRAALGAAALTALFGASLPARAGELLAYSADTQVAALSAASAASEAGAAELGVVGKAAGLVSSGAGTLLALSTSTYQTVVNGELFQYFVKRFIDISVPAVVAIVALIIIKEILTPEKSERSGGGLLGALFGDDDPSQGPPPPRPKAESYNLRVVRLNERFEAVGDVFTEAFDGAGAARGRRSSRAIDSCLRRATAGLSPETQEKVAEALERCARKQRESDERLADLSLEARKVALSKSDKKGAASLLRRLQGSSGAKLPTKPSDEETDAAAASDGGGGGGKETDAETGETGGASGDDFASVVNKLQEKNEKRVERYAEVFREKAAAELALFETLGALLPDDKRSQLLEDLEPMAALGYYAPRKGASGNPSQAEEAGRVFHLVFNGDVQASQVAQLRREVTAVLANANASRGDSVVLELDSGGGTVTGYGFAAAQLERLKLGGLGLTVCVSQVAASGGYLMACVADTICASPLAVLGSIGVVTEVPNVYERLKKEGVVFNTVTAGKHKRTLTATSQTTKEDVAKTQQDLEEILALFKKFVAKHRPQLDIDAVATGEVWFGPEALAKNLCDELKTADELLADLVLKQGREVFSVSTASGIPLFAGGEFDASKAASGVRSLISARRLLTSPAARAAAAAAAAAATPGRIGGLRTQGSLGAGAFGAAAAAAAAVGGRGGFAGASGAAAAREAAEWMAYEDGASTWGQLAQSGIDPSDFFAESAYDQEARFYDDEAWW